MYGLEKTQIRDVSVLIVSVEGFLSVYRLMVMPYRKDLWIWMHIK